MNTVRIYGRLTDFDGNPIEGGGVEIKLNDFQTCAYTTTDENGYYSLDVEKGSYAAIAAVRDYAEKYLEYWGWNLPAYEDTEINMRIDALEIYALNAFLIQRSVPFASLMIYFRPMSLKLTKKYLEDVDLMNSSEYLETSPDFDISEFSVFVNGTKAEILGMSRVTEAAIDNGAKLFGYLLQVGAESLRADKAYQKIHVVTESSETGEKGEASLFWEIPEAFKNAFDSKENISEVII